LSPDAAQWGNIANPFSDPARGLAHQPTLRAAIKARQKVQVLYNGAGAAMQQHVLHPAGLTHQARSWMLNAYSETSGKTETFRLDLIENASALPELF
jgi:predicted DNA-binding transcriptional regulator YafY